MTINRGILFLIVISLLAGCGDGIQQEQGPGRLKVKVTAVQRQLISIPIHSSGKLAARREMKLSFKTGGIIEKIFVREGEQATAGQVLATLNLAEIEAKVTQAGSAYEKAVRDKQRIERLFADSVATLEQLQDAATGLDIAAANLNVAEFNLKYSKIHAPANGKVLKRLAEINELVNAGMPVFLFGSTGDEWIARIGVTDRDIVKLQMSDPAFVFFDAYPGVKFSASISKIAEFADPMSGTYEVELKLNEGNYDLKSGFTADVTIMPAKQESLIMIPIESLLQADKMQGQVFVLNSDTDAVEKRTVQIAHIFDDQVALSTGLDDNTKIVTAGAAYLTDGSRIEIVHD